MLVAFRLLERHFPLEFHRYCVENLHPCRDEEIVLLLERKLRNQIEVGQSGRLLELLNSSEYNQILSES